MITPSYAPTATERVLPRLALDFTTASLDSRVTVTRALNTATCVNSSGFVAIVNADLPRFDYNPVTLACRGLLIEETRTNLLRYAEQFNDATWGKTGSSITADAVTSPDGTVDADKLVENTANSQHRTSQAVTVANATAHTFSFYAKAGERTNLNCRIIGTGTYAGCNINLSNGTVSNNVGTSATITNAGNGWYRIAVTGTSDNTTATCYINLLDASNNNTYLGDGTSGAYIWGAQLEAGAFATSYIPTTTTSLTRNRDTVAMTGTNFSDWYNATAGSIVFDGTASNTTAAYLFAFCGAGNTGNDALYAYVSTNYLVQAFNATVLQANINTGIAGGNSIKVGAGYASNNFGAAANGGNTATDNTYSQPTIDKLRIGAAPNANVAGIVYARKISYYPQRLTNAELQAFSK